MKYPLHLGEKKGQKHVFFHKMLLVNTRKTKICTSMNFEVENSFPVLVFRILENLTTCCDVVSTKFRQKYVFLHIQMLLENTRNTKTCTWTNLGVENSFLFLIFIILENLTTCCDVISPTFRHKKRAKTRIPP